MSKLICKTTRTPTDSNYKLELAEEDTLIDKKIYQKLIERPKYFSHTRPAIAYIINVIIHFLHNPKEIYLHVRIESLE